MVYLPLLILSYQDQKNMEIDLYPILFFIACAATQTNYLTACFSLLILSILKYFSNGIANADIVIISGCANYLNFEKIGLFFILIGIIAIILNYKQKKFPLVPSITLAFFITNIS